MVEKKSLRLVLPISLLLIFSLASPMVSAQEPLPSLTSPDTTGGDLDPETSCSHTGVSASAWARERDSSQQAYVYVEIQYLGAPGGSQSEEDFGYPTASVSVSEDGVFIWVKALAYAENSEGARTSICTNGINPDVCCGGAWGEVETIVHELPLP